MRPDGSEKRTLVEGEHAAWSPDGSHLVFGRRRYTRRSPKESLFLAGNPKILWAPRLDHNVVDGGRGNDRILGRRGQDDLIGGPGRDEVSGAGQDDRIVVRDGEVDVVRCGSGYADTVVVDRFDVIAADCERVHRR
jgi:Ca2+-binding RTX toxin-like protein